MCWDSLLLDHFRRKYIHKIFDGSIGIVESCSHSSFNFRSFKSHVHQLLNCTFPCRTNTKSIGIVECWRPWNGNGLRSGWRGCRDRGGRGDRNRNRARLRRWYRRRNRWCRHCRSRSRRFNRRSSWFRLLSTPGDRKEYLAHHTHNKILFLNFVRFHSLHILQNLTCG